MQDTPSERTHGDGSSDAYFQTSDVSDSGDDGRRSHDRSSSGIFELDPDTPVTSNSGSDPDEPSTPLHGTVRRAHPAPLSVRTRTHAPSAPQTARAVLHRTTDSSSSTSQGYASPGSATRCYRSTLQNTPSYSSPLAWAPTVLEDSHCTRDRVPRPGTRFSSMGVALRHAKSNSGSRATPVSQSLPRLQGWVTPRCGTSPNTAPLGTRRTFHMEAQTSRGTHRRADSGNANDPWAFSVGSPVGGPEGVDPALVAAISAHPYSVPSVHEFNAWHDASPSASDACDNAQDALGHTTVLQSTVSPSGSGSATPEPAFTSPRRRRSEAVRLQRVPHSVATANDLVVPHRSAPSVSSCSSQGSPLPSPAERTDEHTGCLQTPILGLGLRLPGTESSRSRSATQGDQGALDTDDKQLEMSAVILALSRTHKAEHWAHASPVRWRDWTDDCWCAGVVPDTHVVMRAQFYWSLVRARLNTAEIGGSMYTQFAKRLGAAASMPSLRAVHGKRTQNKTPRREHDVFGVRRKLHAAEQRNRVVSDRTHTDMPKLRTSLRRQNLTTSADDSVAAQRRQLWNEVVEAKTSCDADLDKIVHGILEYSERSTDVEEFEPDVTVMINDEHGTYPFGHDPPDEIPSLALKPIERLGVIATVLRGLSLHALLMQPAICRESIHEIQELGTLWDEHPEWPGRGWYVELLLTVAGLSRVLEWWDAEHRFWHMGEDSNARRQASVQGSPRRASQSATLATTKEEPEDAQSGSSNTNVIVELSLEERIRYLSPTWYDVIGTDPAHLVGLPITSILSPRSATIFARATQQLRDHFGYTVEIVFEMALPGMPDKVYIMEAQGMIVHDTATKSLSHTMWVMSLVPDTLPDEQVMEHPHISQSVGNLPQDGGAISTELLLCRICERDIPAWFFEKHSEICHEIHQLEMNIGAGNELLLELNASISDLQRRLEEESAKSTDFDVHADTHFYYRDHPLMLPPSSNAPLSALEGAHALELERTSRPWCLKRALHLTEELLPVTEDAMSISTPAIKEEGMGDGSFNRLLSPLSCMYMEQLRSWNMPKAHDPALDAMISDVRHAVQEKVHLVNRMRNTIVYVETVRMESEQILAEMLEPVQPAPAVVEPHAEEALAADVKSLLHKVEHDAQHMDVPRENDVATAQRSPIPIPRSRQSSRYTPPYSPRVSLDAHGAGHLGVEQSPRLASPISPRFIPSAQPKTTVASIKDFELLKPISKGAYGSVFLARKRATGDYFAVKVLKKSDMVAKNQITNVRAERMILMNRTQSPFVVKLFFTFQSPEYLYLVMEYLPGGDCAALVKAFGALPEEWAQQYLAEIVQGLAYLHSTGVVHRDMKPDNLLIDNRGHLKLTDFGLSKFGLLGRQTRARSEKQLPHVNTTWAQAPDTGKESVPVPFASLGSSGAAHPSEEYFSRVAHDDTDPKRIFGTPDYLAPETILGVGMDDFAVDWWAMGVILFEFLCGYPPFHAPTPAEVFDKILSRNIRWDPDAEMSREALDLIDKLICTDRHKRLGSRGVDEIKAHPFFDGVVWDTLDEKDGPFVPHLEDATSTDYFDPRGAMPQTFDDEPADPSKLAPASLPSAHQMQRTSSSGQHVSSNEFGSFTYKNLPVLKQANDKIVRRILTEHRSGDFPSSLGRISPHESEENRNGICLHRRSLSDWPIHAKHFAMPRSVSFLSNASPSSGAVSISSQSQETDALHVLVGDSNPVSRSILHASFLQAHAAVTAVGDGAEMCRLAMGGVRYHALFVKLSLRVVNGQDVARMIKSTRNTNATTPIYALVLESGNVLDVAGSIFDDVLPLPVSQARITSILSSLHEDEESTSYFMSQSGMPLRDDDAVAGLGMDRLAL
ncbi:non-specific serine/threonine protein kinase [Malassezia vespertilionis]|nr:non-specific serine/threonine protein kinase [Malassezia vespertilionis]WFD05835.1 non-specific serine/threonine protein kinase [Malassezia vespertilionis]